MAEGISDLSFSEAATFQLGSLNAEIDRQNRNIATGRRIHDASDDPLVLARAIESKAQSTRSGQFNNNCTRAESVTSTTGKVLEEINNVLIRAQELSIDNSTTMSVANYSSVLGEVNQLLEQALSSANAKVLDNHLFGGVKVSTPPFVATRDGSNKITAFTFAGSSGVTATFSASDHIRISPFADDITNTEILASLDAILAFRDALDANDSVAVRTALKDQLVPQGTKIADAMARNGANMAKIEIARNRNNFELLESEKKIARDTSTDIATAYIEIKKSETAYAAATQVYSRILSDLGLLKFLN